MIVLTVPESERICFFVFLHFVNRNELFCEKYFKRRTLSNILHLKEGIILLEFVNRDDLYWVKHFRKWSLYQIPHMKETLFLSFTFCDSRRGLLTETLQKTNALVDPASKRIFFSITFCQSRWALLRAMIQKSNAFADFAFEKRSLLSKTLQKMYVLQIGRSRFWKKLFFYYLLSIEMN